MRKSIWVLPIAIMSVVGLLVASGCSNADTGTLEFRANGEDFVREGFVSKDGWSIEFDHLYICLDDVKAYQTDPPYDAEGELDEDTVDVQVDLAGPQTVDLAEGGIDADPILIGEVDDVEAGYYNAISWDMVWATSGDAEGYSLVLVGTAEKEGQSIDFTISIETEYSYSGGEYVGDETKGDLEKDGKADVEITFHFDHLFGDAGVDMDDHVNTGAIGFQPFADLAVDSIVDEDIASLQTKLSTEDYNTLVETLTTLGHVGEGHCHCVQVASQ
jgi:hypothetical protein